MNARAYLGELQGEFDRRLHAHRPKRNELSRAAFQQLGVAVLKRTDERSLMDHSPAEWLGHIEDMLAFVGSRAEGKILVKVGAPRQASAAERSCSVVFTNMPDQPFIVDTLRRCFVEEGHEILSQINVVLPMTRTRAGKLKSIDWEGDETTLESVTMFELAAIPKEEDRRSLSSGITGRLLKARAMVGAFLFAATATATTAIFSG